MKKLDFVQEKQQKSQKRAIWCDADIRQIWKSRRGLGNRRERRHWRYAPCGCFPLLGSWLKAGGRKGGRVGEPRSEWRAGNRVGNLSPSHLFFSAVWCIISLVDGAWQATRGRRLPVFHLETPPSKTQNSKDSEDSKDPKDPKDTRDFKDSKEPRNLRNQRTKRPKGLCPWPRPLPIFRS